MKRILNKIIRDLKYKRSRVLNRGIEPTYLNYKITDLCNLKCKFCNIWKTQRENPELIKKELRAEDIEKILTINSDYFRNLRFIQITGGEPFLKGDLVQIVSIFSKFIPKLEFWFATNGFLPNIIFNKTEEILSQTNKAILAIEIIEIDVI